MIFLESVPSDVTHHVMGNPRRSNCGRSFFRRRDDLTIAQSGTQPHHPWFGNPSSIEGQMTQFLRIFEMNDRPVGNVLIETKIEVIKKVLEGCQLIALGIDILQRGSMDSGQSFGFPKPRRSACRREKSGLLVARVSIRRRGARARRSESIGGILDRKLCSDVPPEGGGSAFVQLQYLVRPLRSEPSHNAAAADQFEACTVSTANRSEASSGASQNATHHQWRNPRINQFLPANFASTMERSPSSIQFGLSAGSGVTFNSGRAARRRARPAGETPESSR